MTTLARFRQSQSPPSGIIARAVWQGLLPLFLLMLIAVTQVALLVGLVTLVLYCRRFLREKEPYVGTGAYGTARWANRQHLQQYQMMDNQGGILLGRIAPRPPSLLRAFFDLYMAPWRNSREVADRFRAALFGNPFGKSPDVYANDFFSILVVSPSGGGKGVSIITPAMLSYPNSAVVLDPKGECFQLTARHRAKTLGHRVRRFDPFNVCGEGADTFNPLATLDPRSPTIVDDCLAIADALVVKNPQSHDPYWDEQAQVATTAFVLYVVMYAPLESRNLNTVAELITDPKEFAHAVTLMQDRQGTLAAKVGRTHAYRSLQRYGNQLSALADKELASVLSSIGRHLAWTNSPIVEHSLGSNSFDMIELARTKTTLYLVLPPDKLESHARLLRLWVTCSCRALVRNGLQTTNPVLFLLDEIGQCSGLRILREGLTVLRGYGAKFVFILQSVAQMKEMFGDAESTVRSGFDYTVCFGLRDIQSAKEMSERIGNATVLNRSTTEGSSTSGPTAFGGGWGGEKSTYSRNQSKTVAEVGRPLIMPDEMIRESARTVFVIPTGKYPIRVTQARYYEDDEMTAAIAAANRDEEISPPPSVSFSPVTEVASELGRSEVVDWAAITHPERPLLSPLAEDVDWGTITSGCLAAIPEADQPRPQAPAKTDRIRFTCRCGKRFSLSPALAGKKAKCTNPKCTRKFVIPTKSRSPLARKT